MEKGRARICQLIIGSRCRSLSLYLSLSLIFNSLSFCPSSFLPPFLPFLQCPAEVASALVVLRGRLDKAMEVLLAKPSMAAGSFSGGSEESEAIATACEILKLTFKANDNKR
jgi:hypothetical protein